MWGGSRWSWVSGGPVSRRVCPPCCCSETPPDPSLCVGTLDGRGDRFETRPDPSLYVGNLGGCGDRRAGTGGVGRVTGPVCPPTVLPVAGVHCRCPLRVAVGVNVVKCTVGTFQFP